MCTSPLRHINCARLVHPYPKSHRLLGVITRLGHHHEPYVIRLAFLFPTHGILKRHRQELRSNIVHQQRTESYPRGDEHTAIQQDIRPDVTRQPLADVSRHVMRNLMAEDRCQSGVVPREGQYTAEDEYLTARKDECIGGAGVVDDVNLPVLVFHARKGDQVAQDPPDALGARVVVGEDTDVVALELVEEELVLHVGHFLHRFGGVDVKSGAPRDGDGLEVGEVENECAGYGEGGYGVGSWGAGNPAEGGFCEEGFGVAEAGAVGVVLRWFEVVSSEEEVILLCCCLLQTEGGR